MMQRRPEPEIMDAPERARAYAAADFAEVNAAFVDAVVSHAAATPVRRLLDLGCGPGDITAALAQRMVTEVAVGIDASPAMLGFAQSINPTKSRRCFFIRADALRLPFPPASFAAVVSNSILHHVRDAAAFWREVLRVSAASALLFHRDLSRPDSAAAARAIVDEHAANEHAYLREDFYNSLRAAYTADEIRDQLRSAGIVDAKVTQITDRHLDIVFRRP
ncbi:MAG: class I SAM-dependent methyltransferase [Candidatus Hydrogenedentales bacterium]